MPKRPRSTYRSKLPQSEPPNNNQEHFKQKERKGVKTQRYVSKYIPEERWGKENNLSQLS